jgi:hypothetical protein
MHCLWTPAFAGAGSCRKAMPTSPAGGAQSRSLSRNLCPATNRDRPSWPAAASAASGNGAAGEDPIRDDRDFAAHFDYTHFNPGQARSGATPYGLAAFFVSSVCGRRAVSCRVDRQQRRTTGDGRAAMRSKPPDRGRRNALRFSTLRLLFNTNVLGVLLATREAVKHFGSSAAISSGRRCSRLRSAGPDSRPTSPQLWCFWLRTMPAG